MGLEDLYPAAMFICALGNVLGTSIYHCFSDCCTSTANRGVIQDADLHENSIRKISCQSYDSGWRAFHRSSVQNGHSSSSTRSISQQMFIHFLSWLSCVSTHSIADIILHECKRYTTYKPIISYDILVILFVIHPMYIHINT